MPRFSLARLGNAKLRIGRTMTCTRGRLATFARMENQPPVTSAVPRQSSAPPMTDWLDLLTRHHAAAQADSGYEPIFGDSAPLERLDDVRAKIGLPLPSELKEFYQSVDGYGLRMERNSMLSPWFIVPTSELPDFVSAQPSAIASSHKSLSERFLPFIDWANGDSMGYIYDRDGKLIDGLHMFTHELYHYESDQEPDDFFRSFEGSIADFLEL